MDRIERTIEQIHTRGLLFRNGASSSVVKVTNISTGVRSSVNVANAFSKSISTLIVRISTVESLQTRTLMTAQGNRRKDDIPYASSVKYKWRTIVHDHILVFEIVKFQKPRNGIAAADTS